jgi:hypothetical protein
LGTTRIKNQISDAKPTIGNDHINQGYFLKHIGRLPVFGQTDEMSFLFRNNTCTPPYTLSGRLGLSINLTTSEYCKTTADPFCKISQSVLLTTTRPEHLS